MVKRQKVQARKSGARLSKEIVRQRNTSPQASRASTQQTTVGPVLRSQSPRLGRRACCGAIRAPTRGSARAARDGVLRALAEELDSLPDETVPIGPPPLLSSHWLDVKAQRPQTFLGSRGIAIPCAGGRRHVARTVRTEPLIKESQVLNLRQLSGSTHGECSIRIRATADLPGCNRIIPK